MQLREEYYSLNQKKQEVIREVVEVSSDADKLRIKQLESQLVQLREEYYVVSTKKQEVIKEVVEVPSEYDRQRIRQLEA